MKRVLLVFSAFALVACNVQMTNGVFGTTSASGSSGGTGGGPRVGLHPDAGADAQPMGTGGSASTASTGGSGGTGGMGTGGACTTDAGPGVRFVNEYAQPCDPCTMNCIEVDCSACMQDNVPAQLGDPYTCANTGGAQVNPNACIAGNPCAAASPQPPPPGYLSCGECYNFLCSCFQFGCSQYHPPQF